MLWFPGLPVSFCTPLSSKGYALIFQDSQFLSALLCPLRGMLWFPGLSVSFCTPRSFNSLHTQLFPMFKRNEAIPLKQNNETKSCTFEIWFAHKKIVNWEDYGNDEDIDFVSYFRILSLKIVTFVSRHYEHMLRSAGRQPYDDVHIWGHGCGVR